MKPFVRFRNAVVRALQVKNVFEADLVIGHDIATLEALHWMKYRRGLRVWLDCVETPKLLERSGDGYRVREAEEVGDAQRYIDERFEALDGVITVGPSIADFLRTTYTVPEVAVVRNFRVTDEIPVNDWIELRRSPRKADKTIIANPTVFKPTYEPEIPLRALALLPEHFEMVHFGDIDSRYGTRAHDGVQRLGLGDRVEFLGRVPYSMYPRFLGVCDIGLSWLPMTHANLQMAFPNRLADFLAAGLPMASSSTPDVATFVREYDLGVVSASDDEHGLANGILDVSERLAEYKAAVQRARDVHNWNSEMDALVRVVGVPQRVVLITQKAPDYQTRTEKMARYFAGLGAKVYYVSARYKEIDSPNIECLCAV